MKNQRKLTWKSPLMVIISVDIRKSQTTEKDYAVVKVYNMETWKPPHISSQTRKGKKTTFLCFKDSLLPLLEPENAHVFEGEIELDWGATYLCITKLFDNEGNRLLRPKEKAEKENEPYLVEFVALPLKKEKETMETERQHEEIVNNYCDEDCAFCDDVGCENRLPY